MEVGRINLRKNGWIHANAHELYAYYLSMKRTGFRTIERSERLSLVERCIIMRNSILTFQHQISALFCRVDITVGRYHICRDHSQAILYLRVVTRNTDVNIEVNTIVCLPLFHPWHSEYA